MTTTPPRQPTPAGPIAGPTTGAAVGRLVVLVLVLVLGWLPLLDAVTVVLEEIEVCPSPAVVAE